MKLNKLLIISVLAAFIGCSNNDENNPIDNPITNTFTDSRDGNVYKLVTIGNQTWMAENLKYLPNVSPPSFESPTNPYNYVNGYFNTIVTDAKATSNYQNYGVLYNWSSAMDGNASSNANPSGKQCLCPENWHLPSKAEFEELKNYLIANNYGFGGSGDDIGKSLASKTIWNTIADIGQIGNDLGTNNASGFNAFPAGNKVFNNGTFSPIGNNTAYWTTSEATSTNSTSFSLTYQGSGFYFGDNDKKSGFSIRCIKN